jgi:hypothetical protein
VKLAKRNRVLLIWVLGPKDIEGNETADLLTRLGAECPFIGPEPACSILAGIAKKALRDWTNRPYKVLGVLNRTQTGKRIHMRTLCQKNQGT